MGHANGNITAPVNTDDVSSVLGVSSHDVATLCTSDKINPAALYRPRYSSTDPGLRLDTNGFNTIKGWISLSPDSTYVCRDYGVWVPQITDSSLASSQIVHIATQAGKTWHIAAPDANSYKILDHFVGYQHSAKVINPIVNVSVEKATTGFDIKLKFQAPKPDGATMSISNLFGTASGSTTRWFFGAFVIRGTGENWTSNDTLLVVGSSDAISSDVYSTNPTVTLSDTSVNNSTEYWYHIVPFVCNRGNVNSSNISGTTFYGIRINDECAGLMSLKAGQSTTGGIVRDYSILWSEATSNRYFPKQNFTVQPTTYHPDVAISINARPSGYPDSTYLHDIISRVCFEVHYYANGVLQMLDYEWNKGGGHGDAGVANRDTQKDNQPAYKDYMFFTIPSFFDTRVSSNYDYDMMVDFYDNNNRLVGQHLQATYYPDYTE